LIGFATIAIDAGRLQGQSGKQTLILEGEERNKTGKSDKAIRNHTKDIKVLKIAK
jgi:hypothetical protein